MSLEQYFENSQGTGVLATSNKDGHVNTAIFARPHIVDEQTVAFVMAHKRSYSNVRENPNASFLFIEEGKGYSGKRLNLTKDREETNKEIIDSMRMKRGAEIYERYKDVDSTLVYFKVMEERPLVGSGS